ncbi:MAG: hypothetical protein R2854_08465 [Caldilineaceae bacterium]
MIELTNEPVLFKEVIHGQHKRQPAQWPGPIFAVTLFVEDLPAAKEFYVEYLICPLRMRTRIRPSSSSAPP